ncbi:MAG TPA: AMP-binding protein [Herbaspirillum sp.]|nr:AMP-binding protein [Herbaspirillum sp.]
MSLTLDAIARHAATRPDAPALQTAQRSITYAELAALIDKLAQRLRRYKPSVLGLLADNGIDWVLADLAALQAQIPIVPLPTYFSSTQLQNTIHRAGIDLLLTERTLDFPMRSDADALPEAYSTFHDSLHTIKIASGGREKSALPLPPGTQKITFTSGTTDAPKGVCLSVDAMERVAHSLLAATSAGIDDRHLCVLPLATLLENIAGVYLPLMAGATCLLPTLAEVGLTGSSGLNVVAQLAALDNLRATSAIIVPQMLTAQVAAINLGVARPRALRYLAVGGGSVSPSLLAHAHELGLPVHEGYGLSECASVVALNSPGKNRPGSVGKPLPHVRIDIAPDGEIIAHGLHFEGYLGASAPARTSGAALPTGDIGHLDQDGYLYVTGRKKSIFITSFGRNVSPEWIERELLAQPGLLQVAVFGEARPFNAAVIVPHPLMTPAAINAAVAAANSTLPDYARVTQWIIAKIPFTADNGLLTHNGRPRRAEIGAAYLQELNSLYQEESNDVL